MSETTHPNSAMMHGGLPILLSSLVFLDDDTFPALIGIACSWTTPFSGEGSRTTMIQEGAKLMAISLVDAADTAGKAIPFSEVIRIVLPADINRQKSSGCGCVGMIILGVLFVFTTALVAGIWR